MVCWQQQDRPAEQGQTWTAEHLSPVRAVSRNEEALCAAAPSHGAMVTSLPGEERQWIIQAHAAYDQRDTGMCIAAVDAAAGDNKRLSGCCGSNNKMPPQLPCPTCQFF